MSTRKPTQPRKARKPRNPRKRPTRTSAANHRVAARQDRTRAEIVAVARGLLAQSPLAGFTLDEIASAVGVTKPALYHYFPNREALIRAAMAEGYLEQARVMREALRKADDGPAVLSAMTTAFVEHYRQRPELFRLDFAWSQLFSDRDSVKDLILPVFNELTGLVAEKLRRGADVSPLEARQLSVIAWTSAVGLMSALSVTAAGKTGLAHPTEALLALINRGLEASARADHRS